MPLRYLIITVILLGIAKPSFSTHIIGGELNYKCLGNNQYEISLTVFRDCYNGLPFFDNPAAIGIFDSANNLIDTLLIDFIQDDTLQPVLFDSCMVIPTNICVHRTTYIDTVTLPFLSGGYQLAYQRCCRNITIVNIFQPNSTGATFYTFISELALNTCNSNPVFNEWPPVFICNGVPINFDHSATDIDGDSLVYEMCSPFRGAMPGAPQPIPPNPPPYDSITWDNGFFTQDMMGGNPLSIDSQSGLLTGTPAAVGQYVVGICVKEYRNGILISETKRDFQYNVLGCSSIFDATFTAPDIVCDGLQVNFTRSNMIPSPAFWDFGVPGINSDTSILNNPTFTYPDTGTYLVTMISGSGQACTDTFQKEIRLYAEGIEWDVMVDYNACEANPTLSFADISIDNTNSGLTNWTWEVNSFDTLNYTSPSSGSVMLTGNPANLYVIRMFVENNLGCRAGGIEVIQLYPIAISLAADSSTCRGEEVQLYINNLDANDSLAYTWSPDPTFVSYQPDTAPTVAPLYTTTYFLEAFNPAYQCSITDSVTVIVSNNAPPLEATASPDSIFLGGSSQLLATYDPNYIYNWFPPETLDDSTSYAPIATPNETTTYIVKIKDTNGCIEFDTVTVQLRNFECEEPYIFVPNAFTPNDDGKNDILYARANVVDDFYFAVYNRWGQLVFETNDKSIGWDGTVNGEKVPPDAFGYFLKVRCLNGATYFKKGNVTILR